MKTKKTKEAVSLIVLVLTIVIMIILAGVIVINLNNSGIIDRAKNAVSETNLKNMQELANVAWGEAYLSIEGEKTAENLKSTMLEKLKGKGVSDEELAKYTFTVTTGGVKVAVNNGNQEETPPINGWVQVGFKVVYGEKELEIGDTFDYTATGSDYSGEWKVLGADDNGDLLIMAASTVSSGLSDYTYLEDWTTGLDADCEPYGNGAGAIGIRNVTIEDIDNVTGYVKTNYEGYGAKETYSYNTEDVLGTWPGYDNDEDFYFPNADGFTIVSDYAMNAERDVVVTIEDNYYSYSKEDFDLPEKVASMLFDNTDAYNTCYYLSSPYVRFIEDDYFELGCLAIYDGAVYPHEFWDLGGCTYSSDYWGVRPVVTIDKDYYFTDDDITDGDVALNPSGTIPEGAAYYRYDEIPEGNYDEVYGIDPSTIADGATVYTAGNTFPSTIETGDVYIYNGYIYVYKLSSAAGEYYWTDWYKEWGATTHWGVRLIDRDTKVAPQLLESINGKPITGLVSTFSGCTSLTTVPVIPSRVENMSWTFSNCSKLTGTITINATPVGYEYCFGYCDMSKITLTGTSTMLDELAATAEW